LKNAAQRIGQGEFDVEVDVEGKDEVGDLAKSLSAMASELNGHQERLEELVQARTRELEEAHEELIKKERLATLGQLTATVSHEIRNPLGAMRSTLYVLKNGIDGGNERARRLIERLERSISRCDIIIDDLLNFTRLRKPQLEPVEIDAWLEDLLEELIKSPDIHVEKDFNLDHVMTLLDPEQLRRAVINVVENACHAMRQMQAENGSSTLQLIVGTRLLDDHVVIRFTDNGVGMEPAVKEKIFEPLFSTKSFGIGLGMGIVKQIVEQHSGAINVTSRPGAGTMVSFYLPYKAVLEPGRTPHLKAANGD
jgi:signal transduction histidine kinase